MARIRKNFVFQILYLMSVSSSAVASLDTTVFKLESTQLHIIQERAFEKSSPCRKLEDDIANRNCMIHPFMYALSARDSKNDKVGVIFKEMFGKLEESVKPGTAVVIAQKAIEGFQESVSGQKTVEGRKALKFVDEQATYYEILNNLMDYLISEKTDISHQAFEFIKDHKIEIPDELAHRRMVKMGLKTIEPSLRAESILSQQPASAPEAVLLPEDESPLFEVSD